MNTQQIVDRARRLTHTNANNYVDSDAVEDLNLVYQEIIDSIVTEVDEDYFWDIWNFNTVAWQSEYNISEIWVAPNELDIKKINKVFVKYDTNVTLLTQARFLNPSSLQFVEEFYETNQPSSDPFFYFKDKSVFIYPAPSTSITEWGRLNLIHVPAELTISSTEDDVEIPFQYHKIISLWMRAMIFDGQWKTAESQNAEVKYKKWIDDMVTFLKDRYNLPWESETPNLTILE